MQVRWKTLHMFIIFFAVGAVIIKQNILRLRSHITWNYIHRWMQCLVGCVGTESSLTKLSMKKLPKPQVNVGSVFWLERNCPTWICAIHGQRVYRQFYQNVVACLRNVACSRRPELWQNQTWMLHHSNVLALPLLIVHSDLTKHDTSVVPHPLYSPGLATADLSKLWGG